MRVTIIGIDGLDYHIVEEMQLHNLQQEVYGKLSIPRECYREIKKGLFSPWTPLCWMSIVTGQIPPPELQQSKKKVYQNDTLDFLRRTVGKHMGFMRGKRKTLMKYGVELTKYKMVETPFVRDMKTIFDLAEKPIDFNIPSYSEGYSLRPFKTETEGLEHLQLFDQEDKLAKKFIKSVLSRSPEYDLLMAYTRAIDHYGHQMFRTESFYNRYKLMDLFIHEIKDNVDGLMLICSDHGFQRLEGTRIGGTHSDYAYYSLNRDMGIKMESLLDIYPLVEKILKTV